MKESFDSFVDGDDERKKIFGSIIKLFTVEYLYNEEETSNSYIFKKFQKTIENFSNYNGETSDISNERYKLFNKAQQLDYYYSNLVRYELKLLCSSFFCIQANTTQKTEAQL